jgi:hypothetical protein
MTSAHAFGDCGDDIRGRSVRSGDNGIYIGDVVDHNNAHDIALIDSSGVVDGIDNGIVGEGNADVVGVASERFVDSLISDFDTVHHMGASSGQTRGFVDEKVNMVLAHCPNREVEALSISTSAGAGDSGGPHYYINEFNNISLLAPHTQHTTNNRGNHLRSFGAAGYAIQEEVNWTIGSPDPSC